MNARHLSARAVLLATALLLVCFSSTASAYTFGSTDTTFATGGILNYKPAGSAYGGLNSMAVQGDGKIVAIGQGDIPAQGWVARFSANGVLDTSFNATGFFAFSSGGFESPDLQAIAIQPDGKIVVSGSIENSGSGANWRLLFRLNSDGTLDTGSDSTPATCFGSSCIGYILSFAATGDANLNDVEVLPGGDILAAGDHVDAGVRRLDVMRFGTDGTLDSTFTNNATGDAAGLSLAPGDPTRVRILQPTDGTFLIAYGSSSGKFAATQLRANGHIETGFGASGTWAVGSGLGFGDAVLRADGRILFVGSQDSVSPAQILALGGIDGTGETDASLGAGGVVATDVFGGERSNGTAVRVLGDGRIFTLSIGFSGGSTPSVISSVFSAAGQLDATYGSGGSRRHAELGGYAYPTSLAMLPGDKPLLGGSIFEATAMTNFGFITRLHGPNDPDPAATITKPGKSKYAAKKLTKFTGKATPAEIVSRVEIALQRVDAKLLKKKRRCLWLASNKAKFKKVKAVKKKCSAQHWLKASGTSSWSYKLKRKLPKGKYVLHARAKAADGTVQAVPGVKKFKVT